MSQIGCVYEFSSPTALAPSFHVPEKDVAADASGRAVPVTKATKEAPAPLTKAERAAWALDECRRELAHHATRLPHLQPPPAAVAAAKAAFWFAPACLYVAVHDPSKSRTWAAR